VFFCVLASGSHGNATWVEENDKAVLIDNGLSAKEVETRAKARGLNLNHLKALAITHEHSDHIKGVGPLARRYNLTVLTTKKTAQAAAPTIGRVQLKHFEPGADVDLGFLTLSTVAISHDAVEPLAYVIKGDSKVLGLLTDIGRVTHLVRESLKNLTALVLEFNHDLTMLLEGEYPYHLKQRVRGDGGHLSNEAGAALLGDLYHPGLKRVVLGHLSQQNNTPVLALRAAQAVLDRLGVKPYLSAAEQDEPTPVFEL
jgi:phosphoribosyl 1,2-cyclic phosphodiesterase